MGTTIVMRVDVDKPPPPESDVPALLVGVAVTVTGTANCVVAWLLPAKPQEVLACGKRDGGLLYRTKIR
jgi:hypothetical protein